MSYSVTQTVDVDHPFVRNHVDKLIMSTSSRARGKLADPPPYLTHSSTFPEQHYAEHDEPIEEEDENETSSEPPEAVTPTSNSQSSFTHLCNHGLGECLPQTPSDQPLIINTPATPPASNVRSTPIPANKALPTDIPHSPTANNKRNPFKTLFRRSNSHLAENPNRNSLTMTSSSVPTIVVPSSRRPSYSLSAFHSPTTSQSNTPPSPSSPTTTLNDSSDGRWEPQILDKTLRSLTGLSLRNKLMPSANSKSRPVRKRSTSASHLGAPSAEDGNMLSSKDFFSRSAETGAGLKARRMSVNFPDDFVIDTVELDKEFTSASKLPGKRGKHLGKGATSTVKLMTRKGHGDEIYAVKEFRKRGQYEDMEEYDKKVKSEYTIARSLHHPNIVECRRLCTHAGRWNVVMEYCSYGELFTLVEKQYLTLDDNLCLWKQLLRGVRHLHDHGIAHRDIKLENLLLNENGHLKITDFGVSEVFCGEHPGLSAAGGECGKNMGNVRRCEPGICGSLPYIAPEVLEKKGKVKWIDVFIAMINANSYLHQGDYDPRPLDVWSCAIVLLTMMFHGQPWTQASKSQPAYAKFTNAWDKARTNEQDASTDVSVPKDPGGMFKAVTKPALRTLILRMMNPLPERRIKIQEAINDRWVKTIECCAHDEDHGEPTKTIDASKGSSCRLSKNVKRSHNHLPPAKNWIPQHRFDMGEGWS